MIGHKIGEKIDRKRCTLYSLMTSHTFTEALLVAVVKNRLVYVHIDGLHVYA